MDERMILTVSQVNLYIKNILDKDRYMSSILVKGEISNCKIHTTGHIYMSLKDDKGVMRAVMFKSSASKLSFKPENGMKVIAQGRVTVYERDGQYQLYIDAMQPDGLGALHIAFEQLKIKLGEEGLFDPKFKRPLPKFPKKIGVVTAPTGAAIRDILNILSRRFSYSDVLLYPVLVQGENAASSIVSAIEYFNNTKNADVMIIGRGGGSIEDLWAFNEEAVARAIFKSEIPIISAVGHEVDFTISDFVADLRAPTPSAAAELVVPSQVELLDKFNNVYSRLYSCAVKIVENRKMALSKCTDSPIMRNPTARINENRMYLDNIYKHFENAYLNVLNSKKQEFRLKALKLDGLSPLGTLARGYSLTKDKDGKVVKNKSQVKTGDRLTIVVSDGELSSIAE